MELNNTSFWAESDSAKWKKMRSNEKKLNFCEFNKQTSILFQMKYCVYGGVQVIRHSRQKKNVESKISVTSISKHIMCVLND